MTLVALFINRFQLFQEKIHRTTPIVLTTQSEIMIQLVAISKIQKDHPILIRTKESRKHSNLVVVE